MDQPDHNGDDLSPWRWVRRPAALGVGALCFYSAWTFPVGHIALSAGLATYLLLLWRWPLAWLIALPAALPILELGFWSGRIFFNAYDQLVLITIAWGLWQGRCWIKHVDRGTLIFALILLISQSLITLNGLLPLGAPVAGAWTDYFASTNALREFKGVLWGLLLWPMLGVARGEGADVQRWLSAGMLAGLAAAFATIVWERGLFTGLFNFAHPYRISGWFLSMHTGGAAIDAFLALSTPFVLAFLLLWRRPWLYPLGLTMAAAALYAFYVTYSRANYPAILVMALVFGWGLAMSLWRGSAEQRSGIKRLAISGVALVVLGAMTVAIIGGQQIQSRFKTTQKDLDDRFLHWSAIVAVAQEHPSAHWRGSGKGSFPRDYYLHHQLAGQHLALAQLHQEPNESFIRFSKSDADGNLFLRQRFTKSASDNYLLKVLLRAPTGKAEALLIEFCERHILKYRAECRWRKIKIPANNGEWQQLSTPVNLHGLGQKKFGPFARPLDISLMNRGIHHGIDIGEVQLIDPDGRRVLKNPDFAEGWDRWFLSYGNHLRWHIKNVFVYWYYEGGLIGLIVMLTLGGYLALKILRAGGSGDYFALLTATALAGSIMVGLFDSLFDDPRIMMLFLLLTGAGLIAKPISPLPLPSPPGWINQQRLMLVGRWALLGLAMLLVLRLLLPGLFKPLETRLAAWAEQRSTLLAKWLTRDYATNVAGELTQVLPAWRPLSGNTLAPGEIRIGSRIFESFSQAVRSMKAGDHLMIGPGVYKQPLVITANNVQISGFGHVVVERTQAKGKAAIITKGNDIILSNMECRHITVSDHNGSCVRHEGQNLTLHHVYFHDAESGVLTGNDPGRVRIVDSRFEQLGKFGRAHGIYMGSGGELLIEDSYFLAAKSWGHEIKSRAPKTRLLRTVVASLGSNDSRLLDLPHGGVLEIENSILEQGPESGEDAAIGFGLEGQLHPEQSIDLIGNIVILEREGDNRLFHFADGAPQPRLERNVIINADKTVDESENIYIDSREQTDIGPYPLLPPVPRY